MKSYYIHQQSLFKLQLNKQYYLELLSVNFLQLKDKERNALALYETDYVKLLNYLKAQKIVDFSELPLDEKLTLLAKANVRITRYFSADNLKRYELDAKATCKNNMSDIVTIDGTRLLKEGEQNCVVVYNNHVYMHPKIRGVSGSIAHEVMLKHDTQLSIKNGLIGISHSSLCHGQQVSFAGSIVYDHKLGWILNTTSGHYMTRVYQIKALLLALRDYGMDLAQFTIELWIPNNPERIPPILSRSDYHILTENAANYLNRMQDSQSRYKK